MRKLIYISFILPTLLLFASGCDKDFQPAGGVTGENYISIQLFGDNFTSRLIDEDNLESEQVMDNISVFFTEPSSEVITHKYVRTGFLPVDDYRLVTIPLNPAELQRRDIYVITNYGNASFNSVNTIYELETMQTPVVNKNNNLAAGTGFCMYGKTLDFDFNNATHSPAKVYAFRTCAKYRVRLTFPENPALGTNNSFLITDAASYTYIGENTGIEVPSKEYFNFSKAITLVPDGNNGYTNNAYTYEASKAPKIHINTRINNSNREFVADLPVPKRNYLYDIDVRIYEGSTRSSSDVTGNEPYYRHEVTVTEYGEDCF